MNLSQGRRNQFFKLCRHPICSFLHFFCYGDGFVHFFIQNTDVCLACVYLKYFAWIVVDKQRVFRFAFFQVISSYLPPQK